MQIQVLASGSTGNATYLQMGDSKILVDAGISARRIKNGLSAIGVAVEDLDGILITHEHRDHISGLPTLTRKYNLPVYANTATWDAIASQAACREIPAACRRDLSGSLDLGDVKIESFSISHDAADPVGFTFHRGQEKMRFRYRPRFCDRHGEKSAGFIGRGSL